MKKKNILISGASSDIGCQIILDLAKIIGIFQGLLKYFFEGNKSNVL